MVGAIPFAPVISMCPCRHLRFPNIKAAIGHSAYLPANRNKPPIPIGTGRAILFFVPASILSYKRYRINARQNRGATAETPVDWIRCASRKQPAEVQSFATTPGMHAAPLPCREKSRQKARSFSHFLSCFGLQYCKFTA